jgi:hypothetical protein
MIEYFLYLLDVPFLCKIITATVYNYVLIIASILFNDPLTKWNYISQSTPLSSASFQRTSYAALLSFPLHFPFPEQSILAE